MAQIIEWTKKQKNNGINGYHRALQLFKIYVNDYHHIICIA